MWLEEVPRAVHIEDVDIEANLTTITVTASLGGEEAAAMAAAGAAARAGAPTMEVVVEAESAQATVVATATAPATTAGTARVELQIPTPLLWSPSRPFLYNLTITLQSVAPASAPATIDIVRSYAGMRTVSLGDGGAGRKSLYLNGKQFVATGWLDQSWWPDGQYTAPTDDALAFDVAALKTFGMNMVRLHQKINPERWYVNTW